MLQPPCTLGLLTRCLPLCQRQELDRSGVTDTSLQVVCQLLRCHLAEGREAVDSCGVSGAGASTLKAPISAALGSCSASLTSCSNYEDREQVRY